MLAWRQIFRPAKLLLRTLSTVSDMGDKYYRSCFEEWGQNDPEMIYLSIGAPDNKALSNTARMWQKATEHRLARELEEGNMFQYGPVRGDFYFRDNLAKFLAEQYRDKVDRRDLYVNTGATNGLRFLATTLFPTGSLIFVEDPTYFIALNILKKELGMNLVGVPTKNYAIDTTEFERLLQKHASSLLRVTKDHSYSTMLYLVPTFNNPTGISYTPEKCEELVRIARKYDVLLFTDDVYNILFYQDAPVKRLFSYDNRGDPDFKGSVVSNGTFSKITGGGMRLGWYELPPNLVQQFSTLPSMISAGCSNQVISAIMSSVIELGLLAEHVQQLRDEYTVKMKLAIELLKNQLPDGATVTEPDGGYFIWITLPFSDRSTKDIRVLAKSEFNVFFACGADFTLQPEGSSALKFDNCIRVCISHYPKDRLLEGLQRMCNAIKAFMKS